jgi:hypothetical protein
VDPPISEAPIDDPEWLTNVTLRFGVLQRMDLVRDQPIRRLVLLKKALRDVTLSMGQRLRNDIAKTTDDKLSWTMMFIRAAESVQIRRMQKCTLAYPHLAKISDCRDPNLRRGAGLNVVRDHAVELARTSVQEEMRALENSDIDALQRQHRQDNLLSRMKRLLPGASTCVNAMLSNSGEVTADRQEIAAILREHWAKVFSKSEIDKDLLQKWLEETVPREVDRQRGLGLPGPSSTQWRIRRCDVERAIQQAGHGMPGPDRIPYKIWKKLGSIGIDILHEAALALSSDQSRTLLDEAYPEQQGHEFNLGILCCLPKTKSGEDEDLGDYYEASSTRPLSLVNTDNRIIASAARLCWEPFFNAWVSDVQRGFLKGRSMLSNVVDVDCEAMTVSLTCARGSLILFDFAAAFPSMSHDYMFGVLEWIGVPPEAMSFIRSLYHQKNV